jgi:hypothetical protein
LQSKKKINLIQITTLKKSIWFKVENRNVNSVNQLPGTKFNHLCEAIKVKEQLEPASTLFPNKERT